ncbi:MAG TPA: hypothetical protein VN777_17075 [Terriglobales bacterium]|nr:hypothetical protein [Terriglobales bacterium]
MSVSSDKMLQLLQQISVLKDLDDDYRAGAKTNAAKEEARKRRKKRRQIGDEMKELASNAHQEVRSER